MRIDYHVHTYYSDDSKYPMEEVVKDAIKLKIDDYNGADGERTQLLEKWRDTFHVDFDFSIFM